MFVAKVSDRSYESKSKPASQKREIQGLQGLDTLPSHTGRLQIRCPANRQDQDFSAVHPKINRILGCAGAPNFGHASVCSMRLGSQRERTAKIALAACLALGLSTLPSSAAEVETFPGVPEGTTGGAWIGPKATGISEVATAKQWIQLPGMFNLAWNMGLVNKRDPDCETGRLGDYERTIGYHAWLYFVSVNAAAPEPFGYVGPFTVRTVAFGNIPVEATVLLGQPRDANGNIQGYELNQTSGTFCRGLGPNAGPTEQENTYPAVSINAPIELSITKLKVDGIDLHLADTCRPTEQTAMELTSKEYFDLDPSLEPEDRIVTGNTMTTPFFGAPIGGLLKASIDIAPFAGCLTRSGDDISPLLTATVSGVQNKVEIRSEGLKSGGLRCARDRTECTDPLPLLPLPSRQGE